MVGNEQHRPLSPLGRQLRLRCPSLTRSVALAGRSRCRTRGRTGHDHAGNAHTSPRRLRCHRLSGPGLNFYYCCESCGSESNWPGTNLPRHQWRRQHPLAGMVLGRTGGEFAHLWWILQVLPKRAVAEAVRHCIYVYVCSMMD